MLKYSAGSGPEHASMYLVLQCKTARQTPSRQSHKIPVYNGSPDRTTAVPSLIQC